MLSVMECFTAADGSASRPGRCQKVMQWNDAFRTWLERHMTHVCAEAHFPHTLKPPSSSKNLGDSDMLFGMILVQFFSTEKKVGPVIMRWVSGLFKPFQEAQNPMAPQHWHCHGNRWIYSFPVVWPPFPGPLWGTCVSASGIWVRWSLIYVQFAARKISIRLDTNKGNPPEDFIDNVHNLCGHVVHRWLCPHCKHCSTKI